MVFFPKLDSRRGFFFLSLFLFFSKLTEFIFLSLSRSLVSYCSETWEIGVSKGLSPHAFTLGCPSLLFHIKHIPCGAWNHIYWQTFWKAGGWLILLQAIISEAFHPLLDQWLGLEWLSKPVPLVLTCTESGLIKIGILNNAVTLPYKRLVIVQQRAQGNTQRKSLETSLTLHGKFTCVFNINHHMWYTVHFTCFNTIQYFLWLFTLSRTLISRQGKNYYVHFQRRSWSGELTCPSSLGSGSLKTQKRSLISMVWSSTTMEQYVVLSESKKIESYISWWLCPHICALFQTTQVILQTNVIPKEIKTSTILEKHSKITFQI